MRTLARKTAPLSIRVRPEIKETLERLATADRRSLASYVEIILEQHIERRTRANAKPAGTKT
jgi:predicted DNA-binding protein